MIDLYYTPSPNGHKITLFLEEAQLQYRLIHVDISKGSQFRPDFLLISPNNKIPAIIDHAPEDGGRPISLFESGEILLYLAEKSGKLLSGELRERHTTLQWLFWQVSCLGPMLGQNHHFSHYAPQTIPYAIERYQVETQRLYNVMNKRLETSPWLGGDHYSIADIACWPWIHAHQRQRIDLDNYPAVNNWHERIRTRPATERAMQQALSEKR
ncbi:GSH-dependent disulfide bond oxidoreductase [Citrobacter portucalensis]|uniref:GSH-dependent disulfide bond oxidoreductase n=1 Tax=Citrobacter portucalensis TaxID=1639133 RepID=UPI001C63E03D|nr:GSH-dependent disulfide bond oxidoreductase [Citrobacter portucalensis]MBW7617760.1 GSH-dependent disulfide bond oxidoreductase [Citrobacter portucalensis]MBW7637484.1 GSH-dependent disulfide bond oxidoreductase [Citrobacter portucalensis]MCA2131568.1 GSH-dependent disulfide bond oxidoreductase [Citrobacter portucalensis]MCA2141747.1 GSH-dependent disulfide bond oxidoreductase [Citrobacter portucalensis]MCA2146830.1 GSH-dependent disulfide bond oxidoreductase [Citrobacter portucalensis]